MPLKTTLKKVAGNFGVRSSDALWVNLALARYRQRTEKDPAYRAWLQTHEARWVAGHWGHEEVQNAFQHAHLASQLYGITEMLRQRLGPVNGGSVLDAGASGGRFLGLLNAKRGVGVNFLPACVEKIRSDGYEGVQGDVEALPFADKSFDYVICCETIEHVLNPVRALNELARVCRKKVFLTVPWLPRTRLNRKPAGWPDKESHIFEFSPGDFQKVLTWTNLIPVYHDFVHVFPEPDNPMLRWWFSVWMYPNVFPKLQFYELQPKEAL